MTNAELIKALRECGNEPYDITKPCKVSPWKLMRDAADALEAAEQRIAQLEAQIPKRGEWISVKDRLPEPRFAREWYLVSLESGCVKTLAFESDRSEWWETGSPVTHWMPLPDAPEVEK